MPISRNSDANMKPTPPIIDEKSIACNTLGRSHQYYQSQIQSSNQSSICKFVPKHSDEDSSPYRGRYQHLHSNEELMSDQYQPSTTP